MLNLREEYQRRRHDIPLSVEAPLTIVFIYLAIAKTCFFRPGSLLKLRIVEPLTHLGLLGVVWRL